MSGMIVEYCPNCETEIEMRWNVEEFGYKAYCPVCGNRLMICSECRDCEGNAIGCDYNSRTDTCRFNKGEFSEKRRRELFDKMLDHLSEIVKGSDLIDTLHGIGFTDAEIAFAGVEIKEPEGIEISEAEEARLRTQPEGYRRAVESVLRDIAKAKKQGRRDCIYYPPVYRYRDERGEEQTISYYNAVKAELLNKGYTFRLGGWVGGTWQQTERICWEG